MSKPQTTNYILKCAENWCFEAMANSIKINDPICNINFIMWHVYYVIYCIFIIWSYHILTLKTGYPYKMIQT